MSFVSSVPQLHHIPYALWQPLPLDRVRLEAGFWKNKQDLNHRISLEHAHRMLEQWGNFQNFRIAAGYAQGSYQGREFLDSDVYKWLEAVAYDLIPNPSSSLRQLAEAAIDLVAAAQEPSGYLNTYHQLVKPDAHWSDLDHGHELYCAGHLFQAAIAYHRATGETKLLAIATRFADHIDATFGPNKRSGTCGHPEIEMALVELYRETGEERYLKLAQYFIDERGKGKMRGLGWYGAEYHQDRVPVRQATEIEGHAVRALYLLSGVTDLYLETGEEALLKSAMSQWHDMTSGKIHITGGVGSRYEGESFGVAYELPNDQCYCETCAAIASIMWNWRMLLATGEARFADVMEQTLYNGFLSGLAADGQHFFYINPLLSRGGYIRAEWYPVACCPPNIMRTLTSIAQYIATRDSSGVQLHHYASCTIQTPLLSLRLETDLPWQGKVKITVTAASDMPCTLSLRIPAWTDKAQIFVNGELATVSTANEYAHLGRTWKSDDVIELDLPMYPRLIEGHPMIESTRCSVAVQRGPLVYCLEQQDQAPGVDILGVEIDENSPLIVEQNSHRLEGISTIRASGYALDTSGWASDLYKPLGTIESRSRRAVELKFIPYYAWGNHDAGAMRVWIPRSSL